MAAPRIYTTPAAARVGSGPLLRDRGRGGQLFALLPSGGAAPAASAGLPPALLRLPPSPGLFCGLPPRRLSWAPIRGWPRGTAGAGAGAGAAGAAGDSAPKKLGVVIVDHGSRRAASNDLLLDFVQVYQGATGREIVEPAHMELAEPSIADAFTRCVERGAEVVAVTPYFLSPGRHWNSDIPRLAAEAAAAHPGVKHIVSAPIGVHALVAQVLEERLQHCLEHAEGRAEPCSMCAGDPTRCRLE